MVCGQVVAYYHQWSDDNNDRGGQFALWDANAPPTLIKPVRVVYQCDQRKQLQLLGSL